MYLLFSPLDLEKAESIQAFAWLKAVEKGEGVTLLVILPLNRIKICRFSFGLIEARRTKELQCWNIAFFSRSAQMQPYHHVKEHHFNPLRPKYAMIWHIAKFS